MGGLRGALITRCVASWRGALDRVTFEKEYAVVLKSAEESVRAQVEESQHAKYQLMQMDADVSQKRLNMRIENLERALQEAESRTVVGIQDPVGLQTPELRHEQDVPQHETPELPLEEKPGVAKEPADDGSADDGSAELLAQLERLEASNAALLRER